MEKAETELQEKDLDIIEGEFIRIGQSRVRNVEGSQIEMQQVAAVSVDAERIEATQCAALMFRGDNVTLQQSAATLAVSNNATFNYSCTPLSFSKEGTELSRCAAGVVAGRTVKVENSASLFVIAGKVEGNMTAVFDWKSTLAAGAVLGGVFGLLSLFRRR
ncbi:MAG: hypothetical protein EPN25_05235 [Nitrospirae bacterium]|nr:MAG: hypothetical protein EPN25_05235 [Nitrospirota bacterium]